MRLRGGCLCGAVRYEAEAEPYNESVCHCGMCRRALGAPMAAFLTVPRAGLRWLAEEPRRYRSSAEASRGFCPHCGTSLTYEGDAKPDEIDLTIPSLDDPEALPPKDHIFTADQLSWVKLADGLPRYPVHRD